MSKPTLKQLMQSVLAAIGVQSNANRERDFEPRALHVTYKETNKRPISGQK